MSAARARLRLVALLFALAELAWLSTAVYATALLLLALGVGEIAAPDAVPGLTVPGTMR